MTHSDNQNTQSVQKMRESDYAENPKTRRSELSDCPKVLCVVGPTATGKTALAVKIGDKYPSVLISADSRQVYKGMDVVTGKDHPSDRELYGIDLVEPDQDCSVAVWYDHIKPALLTTKLPIIVGGTGLYVKAITDGIPTMSIPPDANVRAQLESLSLTDLQNRLNTIHSERWNKMNNSDRNNPRRLVRAIEVALSAQMTKSLDQAIQVPQSLLIGLAFRDQQEYETKISERVLARIRMGAIEETRELQGKYQENIPSLTAIGYRSIGLYIKGKITKDEMINEWAREEIAYAKRQMTWLKKVPGINWFDANDETLYSRVAQRVSSWYD